MFTRGFEPLHAGGFFGRDELDAVLFVTSVQAVIFPVADLLRSHAREFGAKEKVARTPTTIQFVRPEITKTK